MRQLVPLCALLLSSLFYLDAAAAKPKPQPPPNSNLKQFESWVECSQSKDNVDVTAQDPKTIQAITTLAIACMVAKTSMCDDLQLAGCSQHATSCQSLNSTASEWTAPPPEGSPPEQKSLATSPSTSGACNSTAYVAWSDDPPADQVLAHCNQRKTDAKKQCSGDIDTDGISATIAGNGNKVDLNSATCTEKDGIGKTANEEASADGKCKAQTFACAYVCGNAAVDLAKSAYCRSGSGEAADWCVEQRNQLTQIANDCAAIPEDAKAKADKALAAGLQAEASCDKSDKDGTTVHEKDSNADNDSTDKTDKKDREGNNGGMGGMPFGGMPQMPQQQMMPPPAPTPSAASPDCSNPAVQSFGCPAPPAAAAAQNNWNKNVGSSGLSPQSARGNDNVGNPMDNVGATAPLGAGGMAGAKINNADVVQNNTGGPVGNQNGGAGALGRQAAAGAAMTGGPSRTGSGVNFGPDRGGGGYSASTGGDTSTGTTSGWSSYGRDSGIEPIDPRSFLVGKSLARKLAGGDAKIVQIHSKEVNIWSRITDHIKARCNQGLLRDCIP